MNQLTLVIISHNHEDFIDRARRSVEEQDFMPCQLVLLDVASSDDSAGLMKKWSAEFGNESVFIPLPELEPVTAVLQRAEPLVSGEFVAVMSADDFSAPKRFASQISALRGGGEGVAACFADVWVTDAHGEFPKLRRCFAGFSEKTELPGYHITAELLKGNRIFAPTVMMRTKSVRAAIKTLDKTLPFEDFQLWLKIARHHNFLYLPEPLVFYRQHGANFSRARETKKKFVEAEFRILSEYLSHDSQLRPSIAVGAVKLIRRSITCGSWSTLLPLANLLARTLIAAR